MQNRHLFIMLCASLALASPVMAGKVYKWVDKDGNVQFGDQPPSEQAEQVNIRKHNPDTHYEERMKSQQEKQSSDQAQREEQQKNAAEEKQAAEQAKKRCLAAKNNLSIMRDGGRVYTLNDKGEREYVDDKDRAARIKEAEAVVKDACK